MVSAANILNRLRPEEAANEAEFQCSGGVGIGINGENYSPESFFNWRGLVSQENDTPDDPYADGDEPGARRKKNACAFLTLQEGWSFLEATREITLNYTHSEISAYNRDAYAFGGNLQAGAYHLKAPNELPKVDFAAAAKDVTSGQNNFHIKNKLIPQEPAAQPLTLTPVQVEQFNFADAANAITYDAPASVVALRPAGSQRTQHPRAAGF